MHTVIAIDIGVRNISLCVYDQMLSRITFWENMPLMHGRYVPHQNVEYVHKFVEKHSELFKNANAIVIERQMRCNMRIIESVLQSLFFDRAIVVSPRSVKSHYDLGTRNYRENKQKAVEFAQDFVEHNAIVLAPEALSSWRLAKKKDDLADSLITVLYYLDTYSNQLTG